MSKVSFGLQQKDIETIEENLKRLGNNYHAWVEIGKELSWCPLTASIYYQNSKKRTQMNYLEQRIAALNNIIEHYKETNQLEDAFKCQIRLEMLIDFKNVFFA